MDFSRVKQWQLGEVNAGGIAAMVDYVQEARGNARTSAATVKGSAFWRSTRDRSNIKTSKEAFHYKLGMFLLRI